MFNQNKNASPWHKGFGGFIAAALMMGSFFVTSANVADAVAPVSQSDTSSTTFVDGPKYVRENDIDDLDAQMVTPDTTQDVRFFVDGNTSNPIAGQNIEGAALTTSWWRLYTALPAGEHTISTQIKVSGDWQNVDSTTTAYSLDMPTASYVIPGVNKSYRPNDIVVRVRAEDQYKQFDRMVVTIDGATEYTVNRNQCDLRAEGKDVLCDIKGINLSEGTHSVSTTTYTKANNRVEDLASNEFTIDATRPVVTLAAIDTVNSPSIFTQEVTESNSLNGLEIYATRPRASDQKCDPNQPKVFGPIAADFVSQKGNNWKYSTSVDTSSFNGKYCFFSVAEDVAMNHSNPQIQKFSATFEKSAFTLTAPANVTVAASSLIAENAFGMASDNSDMDTLVTAGLTPISIQLKNTGSVASANARIAALGTSDHIQFWAKDTYGNWFDINKSGWIYTTGMSFPANYNKTIDVYVISDTAGDYPVTINFVNAASPSTVLASTSGTVKVVSSI